MKWNYRMSAVIHSSLLFYFLFSIPWFTPLLFTFFYNMIQCKMTWYNIIWCDVSHHAITPSSPLFWSRLHHTTFYCALYITFDEILISAWCSKNSNQVPIFCDKVRSSPYIAIQWAWYSDWKTNLQEYYK